MGRATIPYENIEAAVNLLFPWPTFSNVFIEVPRSYNKIKAPTTVYDRRTGNYKAIGYRVYVSRTRIYRFDEQFRPEYTTDKGIVIVEV